MILRVKPQYGYGWSDGFQTIDTPDIFEISSDQEYGSYIIYGLVISINHEFFGGVFEGSLRYSNDNSVYTCKVDMFNNEIDGSAIKKYIGYCEISRE